MTDRIRSGNGGHPSRPGRPSTFTLRELLEANDELRLANAYLEAQGRTLGDEVRHLRAEVVRFRNQTVRLQEDLAETDRQKTTIGQLHAASTRLLAARERREILTAVQDIIVNLVGSEELCVFQMARDGRALRLAAYAGVDPTPLRTIPFGVGLIGRCAAMKAPYFTGQDDNQGAAPYEAGLSACIPLLMAGTLTGAIAVFSLLPHKAGLEPVDRELFKLIAMHAAAAVKPSKRAGSAPRRPPPAGAR